MALRPLTRVPSPIRPQFQAAQVLTQRYDNKRTGANLQEHILTPFSISTNGSSAGSSEFQKLYGLSVEGQVYAQPLLESDVPWPDGTHKNVLVVATMANMVHAFAVDDAIHLNNLARRISSTTPPCLGTLVVPCELWRTSVGEPVPANFMPMAFSTLTCVIKCWPNDTAPSVPAPLPPVGSAPTGSQGYYNINPFIGILGTPVIDASTQTIYLVAKLCTRTPAFIFGTCDVTSIQNRLFAIDLISGGILATATIGDNVMIKGSASDGMNGLLGFDQNHQMQRPALLLQGGHLYIAFGSHQDTPPWHGWIFRFDPTVTPATANSPKIAILSPAEVWCSTPDAMGGSIWQAGSGIAADDDGNIFVMTGNGYYDRGTSGLNHSHDGITNVADMFVKLDPSLNRVGLLAPSDLDKRESEDIDLGSAGPVLIPGTNTVIGADKEGLLFAIGNGGFGKAGLVWNQVFQAAQHFDSFTVHGSGYHHVHGSPVVWNSQQKGTNAYLWAERDVLRAFHWTGTQFGCGPSGNDNCATSQSDTAVPFQQSVISAPACSGCMPGGFLSVSAEGNTSGTGILWGAIPVATQDSSLGDPLTVAGGALNNVIGGELHAFDAEDISKQLWTSTINPVRDGGYLFAKYAPPMVANGRVYMATFSDMVNVYGLRQWAKFMSQTGVPQQLQTGETFKAYATFFNAGVTPWQTGTYELASESPQDNSNWGINQIDIPHNVYPGESITLELNLKAPQTAGMFQYQWRMVQKNVERFGDFTPPGVFIRVGHKLVVSFGTPTTDDHNRTTVQLTFTEDTPSGPAVSGVSVSVDVRRVTLPAGGTVTGVSDSHGQVTLTYLSCIHPRATEVACKATASKNGYGTADFEMPLAQ